jgi:hypothetical protein
MEQATGISAQRVRDIFMDCLFKDGEPTDDHIKAEGVMTNVGFHPQRLESHKQEIMELMDELPDEFKADGGGGMSFLNACMDRRGKQWTGEHRTMEQLFQLGVASGKARCLLPREMWAVLPGGMPYYVVL